MSADRINNLANDSHGDANDEILEKLTQSQFDPAQYLNEVLPTVALSSQNSSGRQSRISLLQASSSTTQEVLSKISTHNIRSSSELNSLTDDILRSGSRLAYEVEVLRGDANNLYELLTDTLREEIQTFVSHESTDAIDGIPHGDTEGKTPKSWQETDRDPEFMKQLRTLGLVKSRLEAVINVFGEALKWPIPPSEVSMASSLISVSAPELGVANSAEDDKAREATRRYREEVGELLESDGAGYDGVEAATKRVNKFRELSTVWKGTVEEKARARVVDGLGKLVDDRKRALDARNMPRKIGADGTRSSSVPGRSGTPTTPASGIFGGLRKLRDEIYLE